MKIRNFILALAAFPLTLGFTACSDDASSDAEKDGNTHVSVTLKLAVGSTTRALPEDYNYVGKWAGKDEIKTVAIFVVDGATVTTGQYEYGDFTQGADANGNITLTPTKAIKTTEGLKKVYALINGTTEVINALSQASAADFEAAYTTEALALANSGVNTPVSTSASRLIGTATVADKEAIVMTNAVAVELNVVAGVTSEEALAAVSPKNRASVNVERAVARVMITIADNFTSEIKSSTGVTIGAVSNVKWVLAQGENSLYIQKAANYETPAYTYIPTTANDYWTTSTAADSYDYSGLFENYVVAPGFGGTTVPTLEDYAAATIVDDYVNDKALLDGKFVLATTHESAAAPVGEAVYQGGYRKGNSVYVLIRAKFTPTAFAANDDATQEADGTFYLGANGKFYKSPTSAVTPAKGGVTGQTVAKYVGGKVLYYAWVNPDNVDTQKWYNSPVIRNNIYHIHINGFKTIGTNWNPLYPEDPDTTNPKNPDPKPNVPGVTEPENPVDPTDPLTTPETWMSVDVAVLPWTIHSYSVDL